MFRSALSLIVSAFLGLASSYAADHSVQTTRPNVLMISVDDLRPELSCYGASHVVSPNIDRFADTSMLFQRAYCQQAVCNPSRTSLMTGLRPDAIGVTSNHVHFRSSHPNVVTLPQHFKNHGYHTAAIGKIYHGVFPDGASKTKWDTMGDPPSWSVPSIRFGPRYYYTETGIAAAKTAFRGAYPSESPEAWAKKLVFGVATESPDVPDNTLYDGKVADAAVNQLALLSQQTKPFFLAVGFIKPHSPYIAPKRYFDLYQDVAWPKPTAFPQDTPSLAGHASGELRRYTDQPNRGPFSSAQQQRMRHAYLACVSYIDAQIGRVLKELERSGREKDTIVCLYGDHGYHLGEQGLWGKTTNFELDTRVPLIVRSPGMKSISQSTQSLVELVDLYPTLAELAGLPIDSQLQGKSFAPILESPEIETKSIALSQYPRGDKMGYSIRTANDRLTQWIHRGTGTIEATEFYDYSKGLVERRNLAAQRPDLVKKRSQQLVAAFGIKTNNVTQNQTESFESCPSGPFKNLETSVGTWRPINGRSLVDAKHAKSGRKCLQLAGGDTSTIELAIADGVVADGDLTFWAERWTRRAPFSFRVEKFNAGKWTSVFNGDKDVRVGRAFLSNVRVPLNDASIRRLRFTVTSPPNTGILIDDIRFTRPEPQQITSVQVIPFVLPALLGAKASPLLKLRIETTGSKNPLSIAKIQTKLADPISATDIQSLRIYDTESSSDFSTALRIDTLVSNTTTKSTTLPCDPQKAQLIEGTNYIWVAGILNPSANIDHVVGVIGENITFSNGRTVSLKSTPSIQRMGIALRQGGDDGVHTFRIPGLATTNDGTLIGVYDVRRRGGGDLPGDIDVGMSRSRDGGKTWDPMQIIMNMGNDPQWKYDGIGDPTVLVDRVTGTIWCAATWSHGNRSWFGSGPGMKPTETGQFMLVKSEDDGVTWSEPINITSQVKKPEWSFLLQGPGKGITMGDGTLVLPAQYQDPPNPNDKTAHRLPHSTFVYSQDHGRSWSIANGAWDDTTESQVVELTDGELMINCRNNRLSRRAIMTTSDLGKTWTPHATHNQSLIEPGACMASIINVGRELAGRNLQGFEKTLLLFSNPDSLRGRNHITVKASRDTGATWPAKHHLLLDEQDGRGYSCMTMIDSETVGILYEGSQADMTFQRIKINDILNPPKNQKTKNPAVVNEPADTKKLSFARPFGDHMVLQADRPIRFWGRGPPLQTVTIGFADSNIQSVVDSNGNWSAELPPQPAILTPQVVTATCDDETITIGDVLIGEIWLCAGQSNMEWPLAKTDGGDAIAAESNDPLLRLHQCTGGARGSSGVYSQKQMHRLDPKRFTQGEWIAANGLSTSQFSAVGYYFAKRLRTELNVPIGIINVSVGGTPIESWVSRASLSSDSELALLLKGNWLFNPRLDAWCQTRARSNLRRGLSGELAIPNDELGPNHSFKPGFMHEAAIKPFSPLAIRGVLWYQGESNADNSARTKVYDRCFPLLLDDLRASFHDPQLPVGFVQLPALRRSNWPVFREYQRRSLERLQNVGMAVTIDTGDPTNVHPDQKEPVGDRLAQWALTKSYGKAGPPSGPLYHSKHADNDTLVLSFRHADGLATSDGRPPNHFELRGKTGTFHSAVASIQNGQVILRSENVVTPIHARYAWSDYPDPKPNLVNSNGLPASPFTTELKFHESEVADSPADTESANTDRPNILLIVSEDNGPELGCYGDAFARTPNLDRLASEGVRFQTAYVTQSVCSPSRSTLFTGLYPHQNGQIGLATHQYSMFREWPTTYSVLKRAGYRTGLIGKTHVNPATVVEDYVDFREIRSSNFGKKDLSQYSAKSSEFICKSDQPFFLTVNFPDAHWPLQNSVQGRPDVSLSANEVEPMPYVGSDNPRLRDHVKGYYNCITRLDECVGQLLSVLNESGKADNTMVIYIGDHGAQFARGKVFVTEGGLRIPFIIRWPGKTKPGLVSQELVSTIDILPTIVSAAGAAVPHGLPGKNLASILAEGPIKPLREYLFGERNCDSANLHFPQRAIRDRRYKLIQTLLTNRQDPGAHHCLVNGASNFRGSPTYEELKSATARTQTAYATWLNPPKYQLYDLQADPHEFTNRAGDPALAEVQQRLIDRLRRWQVETNDTLRYPEALQKLTAENDACLAAGIRSPTDGWKYVEYLSSEATTAKKIAPK